MKALQTASSVLVAAWYLLGAPWAFGQVEPAADEPTMTTVTEEAASDLGADPFAPDDAAGDAEGGQLLPWETILAEARRAALAERKPLLIRAGADWCTPCREMEKEIEKPAVQAALREWTLAYVDLTSPSADGDQLGIDVVPAWRISTALGVEVATRDGYLPAEELVAWLKEHHGEASALPASVLLETGPPSAVDAVRLVRQFSDRSPLIRETAVRRLLPHPGVGCALVVKAFCEGDLAGRLSTLELLEPWGAPLEGIDPWVPETITPERLAALERWAETPPEAPPVQSEQLDERLRAEVDRQIARMLEGTEQEAAAVREQLVGLGPALMPEIYARLNEAATDQHRSRLLAMRYRLVASDSLVLRWPGGIVELAAGDFRQRQKAAEQLATLAGPDDKPLLLELFSDPDPLVRETSLRGLQNIGGEEATAALVKLLADPEPNVRAAVLKQLEESPQPDMVAKVAEYLETEQDPDLVVHAIRFLRTAGGDEATRALLPLLKHASWQVRAEAAAGLAGAARAGDVLSGIDLSGFTEEQIQAIAGPGYDGTETSLETEVRAALMELLEDPDPFVVSRALESLPGLSKDDAIDPLIAAVERHPQLAPTVVGILANAAKSQPKVVPLLREYAKNESPVVRAAAIAGLFQASDDQAEWAVLAGLGDADPSVRAAAAAVLFRFLDQKRRAELSRQESAREQELFGIEGSVTPRPSLISQALGLLGMGESAAGSTESEPEPPPAGPGDAMAEETPAEPPSAYDQWLLAFREGKGRPAWAAGAIEPLEKMLASEDDKERLSAAIVLVALGRIEEGLPPILEAARSDPQMISAAVETLPWLVWPERLDVVNELLPHANEEQLSMLVYSLTRTPDSRMAGLLWEMLGAENVSGSVADALHDGLLTAYTGSQYVFSSSDVTPAARLAMAEAARPRIGEGSRWQRLVALVLLMRAAPAEAAAAAAKIADDPHEDAGLRDDATLVRLAMATTRERVLAAIDALGGESVQRRQLAVEYLVLGSAAAGYVGNGAIYLNVENTDDFLSEHVSGQPIIPTVPAGVTPEHVRPMLDDPDARTAAYAGYLLAVMEDPAGLPPLLKYWRKNHTSDYRADDLMVRAIARLDDASQLPVLEEIYGRLDEYEVRRFYWTVRIMSGEEILAFRAKIRDKVGAENLR